jgi:3',5'-cyclic-AMP phosphodiesterase
MMSNDPLDPRQRVTRRQALACLAHWSGAAVVWTVAGGVPHALGATRGDAPLAANTNANALTFVQISDTHIGFRKAARELLQEFRVDRVHTVPGEHDTIDDGATGYLRQFDHDGNGRSWYSFDQGGVHFVGLNNVLAFKAGTLAALGDDQLAWLRSDLAGVRHSTPIVVLAHIPLWTIWEPWGWGTADSAQALALLRPFGSVTVLNGHIHQVLQKVEGNVELHTAMSLAYPLPTPGQAGIGEPGPVTVASSELPKLLGTREVSLVRNRHRLALVDRPFAA